MAVDDDGNTKSRPRIFMGEIYVLSMINDCDAKYGLYWWFAMSRSTQWIVRTAPPAGSIGTNRTKTMLEKLQSCMPGKRGQVSPNYR
jgi:hypothetical protein